MSDDNPLNDPWTEEVSEESYELEEEAVNDDYPVEAYDQDWDDEVDDLSSEDDAVPMDDDIDASFYEPPEPPITDAELEPEEPPEDGGGWFRANWWRLLIIVILVVIIIFLLVRACGGKTQEEPPTQSVATSTPLVMPTFTPTLAALPTQSLESGSEAPASGGLEATPEAPAVQPTQPPAPTAPPATGGKFTIGQTVVVTGTGKDKLSFRAGPGTDYKRVRVVKDGVKLTVIGGPEKADGFTWWQLKAPNGQVGWAVEDYLKPLQ